MSTIINPETQSIVVGSGSDRIAISLKQATGDTSSSLLLTSIVIEMGDLEIQIRRSTRAPEESKKRDSIRSRPVSAAPAITYPNGNLERKIASPPPPPVQEQKSDSQSNYWDYSVTHGPQMWGRIFPAIQAKKFQSPIRIYTDQCEYEPDLARHPFIFESDENCCQTLENTGHSFQVSGKGNSHITGGPVPDEYQFLQFHMHWGSNDLEGSEHVLDGIRYPGELHIVTWNTSRYKTPQAAAASEDFDGLMVFGILIKIIPDDNPMIAPLLDLFAKITHKGDKINLDPGTLSLKSLLPHDMQNYYTYDGSLTTPMCYESVRWIVFRERMGLSKRQFDQMRQLKQTCATDHNHDEYIRENFRPVMPLNGRVVYRSFS